MSRSTMISTAPRTTSAPTVTTAVRAEPGGAPLVYAAAEAHGLAGDTRFIFDYHADAGFGRELFARLTTARGVFVFVNDQGEGGVPLEPEALRALAQTLTALAETVEQELPEREAEAAALVAQYAAAARNAEP